MKHTSHNMDTMMGEQTTPDVMSSPLPDEISSPVQDSQQQANQGQMSTDQIIVQVAQLLMQGASVQELLQMGVPQGIIDVAIKLINEQQGGPSQPTPAYQSQAPAGLAASNL